MTVLEQCQVWHEQDKHNAIVNTLEALPDSQRTAETDMEAGPGLQQPGRSGQGQCARPAVAGHPPDGAPPQPAAGYVQLEFPDGYAYYYLDMGDAARRTSNGLWPCIPGTTPASTPSASCGR